MQKKKATEKTPEKTKKTPTTSKSKSKTKPLPKNPPKRKNVSQKIPNGRTLQTRDEFFEGQSNYRKPSYENKGLYRKAVVVDSNRKDELAVVKLTTSEKGIKIKEYQNGKSKYRPFVETKDDKGKPIKIGEKFKKNSEKADMPTKELTEIKRTVFKTSRQADKNRQKVRKIKGRKK